MKEAPLRILLATGAFPPVRCGVGDYSYQLARALASTGSAEVGILTGPESPQVGEGHALQFLPPVSDWGIRGLPHVVQAIRGFAPDLVHLQYPTQQFDRVWTSHFLPIILRLRGFPVVETWHEFPGRFRYFPNAIARDTLIVVDPSLPSKMLRRYRFLVARKRIRFIPIASNIPRISLTEAERTAVRSRWNANGKNLVTFFGFANPPKGVEVLFKVADPALDRLVLICDLNPADSYQSMIADLVCSHSWSGRAVVTGFQDEHTVSALLGASDATILPFLGGVRPNSGSFLAAIGQGTLVVTTSLTRRGYDREANVFYAAPGDVEAMRQGLRQHLGAKSPGNEHSSWPVVAHAHLELYREALAGP